MGKLYRIRETDDNNTYELKFLFYEVFINYGDYHVYFPSYSGMYQQMIDTMRGSLGDAPTANTIMWIHPDGDSSYPKGSDIGVPGRSIATAVTGTRWYFTDNNYVRLSGISVNQYGTYTLTYQFCINNAVAFTKTAECGKGGWIPLYPNLCLLTRQVSGDGTVFNRNEYSIPYNYSIYYNSYYGYRNIAPRGTNSLTQAQYEAWIAAMSGAEIDPDNPYAPGGTSDEGDEPEGNFSEDSDDVSPDAMPDETYASAVGSKFATIFLPTKTQLNHLADVMWGSSVVSFFQNMIENIKDMFISLGILPFVLAPGATKSVKWLGIVDTAISLNLAPKQFYEFDMGSIDLGNDSRIFTSGSALDYSPYSRLGIYLPFIGYQELNIDECRGAVLSLKYRVDILSGCCVAILSIGSKAVYQFSGNCLTQIPLTGQDMSGLLTGAITVATAGVALGASSAVASAGTEVTAERVAAGEMTTAESELASAQRAAKVSSSQGMLASATANAAMGIKPNFSKTGAISGANSLLAVKQPYLFLTTPRQSIPDHYQRYCGFPSNISGKLNTFSGYTVVEDIRLNGLVATSSEVEEIYNLLKSGVII